MNIFEKELMNLPKLEDKNQSDIKEIRKVTREMYKTDKKKLVKFILYIGGITRVPKHYGETLTEVFYGKGLRNNCYWRLHELARLDHELFMEVIHLLPTAGSWRTIFDLIYFDIMVRGFNRTYIKMDQMAVFIAKNLQDKSQKDLILKYLPSINNKSKTKRNKAKLTFAKYFCSLLFGAKDDKNPGKTYKLYRKLKGGCNIIDWQKNISNQNYDFDLSTLGKRALKCRVTKNFLKNKPELKVQYDILKTSFEKKKEEIKLNPTDELEFAFNQELMELVV